MPELRLRAAAALAVAVLALAGCGTDDPTPTDGAADGRDPAAAPTSAGASTGSPGAAPSKPREAEVAPELEFTAETIDGDSFDGPTLAGKDTVLWFWAPWCSECRREAPYVAAAQADRGDVTFVGVAGLGNTSDMQDFVDDYDVDAFEHLADLDGSLWQRFGVVQQPAYAFIDADGTIEVVRGALGEAGLAEQLDTLTSN